MRGDGRIHRRAAGAQHFKPGLGSQRIGRGDHVFFGEGIVRMRRRGGRKYQRQGADQKADGILHVMSLADRSLKR